MAKGENTTDRFTHNENPPPPAPIVGIFSA
jgi:hypothetical protein